MSLPGSPRLPYTDLPLLLRARIEAALGAPVVSAATRSGGFSPGTAAVVTCADGSRAFVKAVGTPLNPDTHRLHRQEAVVTAALPPSLPPSLPTPRLRWSTELTLGDDVWVALVFDVVDGTPPALPWTPESAAAVLPMLTGLAAAATPSPVPGLPTVSERVAENLASWATLAAAPPPDLDPWERRNLDWLAEAPARPAASGGLAGDTLVHLDVRADNLLVTPAGTFVVDWPWAARGAPWVDTVVFALDAAVHGGVDAEALVAGSPLVSAADPAAVTDLVLGLTGMWAGAMRRPPPPGLPTVRAFQRQFHDAALAWGRQRAGGRDPS